MRRLQTKAARAALLEPQRAARARRYPGADGGGRERIAHPEHARRAPDRARRGAPCSCSRRSKRCWPRRRWSWTPAATWCATRDTVVSLATRPVLFALARALAEAWPGDVPRNTLLARAFRARHADESHRARLRVEIGRLRTELRPLADVSATKRGLCAGAAARMRGRRAGAAGRRAACRRARVARRRRVVVQLGPGDRARQPAQRTVQRALDSLAAAGKVQSFGRGRRGAG